MIGIFTSSLGCLVLPVIYRSGAKCESMCTCDAIQANVSLLIYLPCLASNLLGSTNNRNSQPQQLLSRFTITKGAQRNGTSHATQCHPFAERLPSPARAGRAGATPAKVAEPHTAHNPSPRSPSYESWLATSAGPPMRSSRIPPLRCAQPSEHKPESLKANDCHT
eukprot:4855805-Amphidinium_carterae.1